MKKNNHILLSAMLVTLSALFNLNAMEQSKKGRDSIDLERGLGGEKAKEKEWHLDGTLKSSVWVTSLAINCNKKYFVIGGRGSLGCEVYNLSNKKRVHALPDNNDVTSVAIDGHKVLSGSSRGATLWDIATGQQIRQMEVGNVSSIAFDKGQVFAGLKNEGLVKLWDPRDNQISEHTIGGEGISMLDYDAEVMQAFIASVFKRDVVLLDLRKTKERKLFEVGNAARDYGIVAAFNAKKSIGFTGSRHSCAQFWNLESGECLKTIRKSRTRFTSASGVSQAGTVLTASEKRVRLWDFEGNILYELISPSSYKKVALDNQGKIILVGEDNGTIKIFKKGAQATSSMQGTKPSQQKENGPCIVS